jgi:hypothetical protein
VPQTTTFILFMSLHRSDLAVLRDAIAREQLPPWGRNSKRALVFDAGIFVVAAIGHYFEWRTAGAVVTLALCLLLAILATAPRPRRQTPSFFNRPVSVATVEMLVAKLGVDTLKRLSDARDSDKQTLLRVGHLQQLLSLEASTSDQQAAWRAEVTK